MPGVLIYVLKAAKRKILSCAERCHMIMIFALNCCKCFDEAFG